MASSVTSSSMMASSMMSSSPTSAENSYSIASSSYDQEYSRLSYGQGVGQDFCTRPPSLLLSPARLRNIGDGNRNSPIGPQGSEGTPMGGLGGRSSPYASPRRPLTRGGGRGGQSHYSTLDLGFQTSTPAGKNYSSNQGGPRPPLPC